MGKSKVGTKSKDNATECRILALAGGGSYGAIEIGILQRIYEKE